MAQGEAQAHPIRVYLYVWGLLFVLSVFSYMVDFFHVEPIGLKWFLLIAFAVAKSGLIITYFMHVRWERLSLVYTIALPPLLVFALTIFAMSEGSYVQEIRQLWFSGG